MITRKDIYVQEMRRHEQMAAAKRERLLRRAARTPRQGARLHARLLARLGDGLVAWGCRLQARYRPFLAQPGGQGAAPTGSTPPVTPCASA